MPTMIFRNEELEMLHKCLVLARQTALMRYTDGKLHLEDYVRLDAKIGTLVDRVWEVMKH